MSIDQMNHLVALAGRDQPAQAGDKQEAKAGLPSLPAPAPLEDDIVIVVTAPRGNPSAPSTSKTLDKRAQAEELLDPTSV
jgi:hypothetical protein